MDANQGLQQKIYDFYPFTNSRLSSSSLSLPTNDPNVELQQLLLIHQTILCLDCTYFVSSHHSGEFLFNCLLIKLLSSLLNYSLRKQSTDDNDETTNYQILLVLANHTRDHYDSILRKQVLTIQIVSFSLLYYHPFPPLAHGFEAI